MLEKKMVCVETCFSIQGMLDILQRLVTV